MRIQWLLAMALLLVPRPGVAQPATSKLEDFLDSNRCTSTRREACLHPFISHACASGCVRLGYNWTANANDPTLRYRVDLHQSLRYLKLLRNAAMASPGYVLRDGLSFGLPLQSFLYHQVQAYLHADSAKYYDRAGALLPHSAVVHGNHTVDPARFFMLAFDNEGGAAQAMAQGDFGGWLLSLGFGFAGLGQPQSVEYYLRLSERVFTSFAFRHDDGGVRNNKRSYRCYGDQYCYWFHSFVAGKTGKPQNVLNQNLHAIRDALNAHAALASWRDDTYAGMPLPPGYDQHIKNLRDFARGGLNQLAYGLGHAADYSAPPTLIEFLENNQNDPLNSSVKRYNASYNFDMETHARRNGNTPGNVCHYHYHDLEMFKSILTTISTNPYYKDDPDFIALYYKLLYGRSKGDTRSCSNRSWMPPSRKVMRGLPLAELFYGGKVYSSFPNNSSFPYGHCADALWFQYPGFFTSVSDAQGMRETRAFFEQAYAGCEF